MTATYQGPQPGVGTDDRIVPVKTWLRPSTYRALAHHAQQRRVDVGELISLLADQSIRPRTPSGPRPKKRRRILTPDERVECRRLRADGWPLRDIADRYGISIASASKNTKGARP